jgi:hypothetical protein
VMDSREAITVAISTRRVRSKCLCRMARASLPGPR